jgi:hypothetical protein
MSVTAGRSQNSCWRQNLRLPEASQPPLGETREDALARQGHDRVRRPD